ncbi:MULTISPECIES: competence type IV pilus assembly protein ComGB [unclassified Planococcus (in: firmicutes)]|uniref:competence type IV pilus assembly protein ComGB n=1 Tax=unclassified Planococcus (in: firmicutes) TaxID=2662419 RepID=UPI000C338B64|nr:MULTISPECIES: competence type IV pilus assembly protein ComGB [unclassified Planococcus (in: firmicutes)]AUD13779.1 competence protein ComG [Planococcus sp. MB-3u-03]PKG45739.1 competence protein ComG [Planococcus sp. Urea-trap-24]PKG88552.1 competence protein ComG [Planococcus sp. Urea-3u-39]PKH38730.1 competence protein ComG [Planococcus sp. MB-3u-09]
MRFIPVSNSRRVPFRERGQFLTRLSVLMSEGYLFPVAMTLLLPMHTERLDEALAGMDRILKGGGNAAEVLKFLGFRERVLFPVEIAEFHGKLSEAMTGIAAGFKRTEEVQKKLRNILVYPVSLLILTAALFLFFRTNYVPNLTALISSLQHGEEGEGVPVYLLRIPDVAIAAFTAVALIIIGFREYIKRQPAERQISLLIKLPVIGPVMRLYWSQIASRELGTLLHSGISLQEALKLLRVQRHHAIISQIAESLHDEVKTGIALSVAVGRHDFAANDMAAFIRHGEATGMLGKELMLYSEVLLDRIELQAQRSLKIIQPSFFVLIAVCIVAAYLAILLPMYNLVHTI